ncbi:hypothetical protein Hypma_012350 [Hypsizygus marmoreus]|uniref:Uncharacterized protein n=1 Tax=Hypsizygus marmoreus TaxID=39966 RepID=A0A369KBD2_HYPMA|nr:hypothetical protein Hypma_012350 [Hypsizygus marmoreus]
MASDTAPQIHIALYSSPHAHQYHWAIAVAPTRDLSAPARTYQIRMRGGPWEDGRDIGKLDDVPTFLCCIPLPPLLSDLATAEELIASQPVEQGTTVLLKEQWSCSQWLLRTVEELIAAGCLPDAFHTRHRLWKEMLSTDIIKLGDEATRDASAGSLSNGVRVLSFKQ